MWEVLEECDQDQLGDFLKFVTGCSRLPMNGFDSSRYLVVKIYNNGNNTKLPEAHTCFYEIVLPNYSSKEILKEKLMTAITAGRDCFLQG
mmetsp:Transcript_13901/g.11875  ORF Transcript_13901/g.11875 Transcript_13901/m.11875 type:complete len:90 (+) Transcript_13901:3574-3843(+)